MTTNSQRRMAALRGGAFTLVELLVVIGMVALGVLMLAPALARTNPNNAAFQCMNNLRQLQRALAMYAADNSGKLAANLGAYLYDTNTWCTGVLDWGSGYGGLPGQPYPNTNTFYLLKSALGPYTGSRASVYKCPADNVPSTIGPRVRSYSMNCFVGCTDYASLSWFPTSYRVFFKDSDFTRPGPAMTFVFIDEHPDSINDCMLSVNMPVPASWPASTAWVDLPASHHNGAGCLSFADGHVEAHRWLDAQTVAPIQKVAPAGVAGQNGYGTTSIHDNAWMAQRASAPY